MDFKELLVGDNKQDSDIRILDFNLLANKATAKVLKFGEKSSEIIITFEALTAAQLQKLANEIADNCYYMAALLADTRTQELRDLLTSYLAEPYYTATIDGRNVENDVDKIQAVAARVSEMFEDSFWNFFLAFGVGKEELSTEIFRARRKHKTDQSENEKTEEKIITPEQVEKFWDLDRSTLETKYDIRADELPASTLRRLDPLPLSGLEEDADPFFVETYERVSRLAQSYGLSLVSE